jgi:hypothetical protein
MTKQVINTGSTANDGTGDSLRQTGQKINDNFSEVYTLLGADSGVASVRFAPNGITFEGTSIDGVETTLSPIDPTSNRTQQLPDADGIVVLDTATQTLTNKTLTAVVLSGPIINDASDDNTYTVVPGELAGNVLINLPIITDSDSFVLRKATGTLLNKTISGGALVGVSITDALNDANGASLITAGATGSAVNDITITNAAAGGHPTVASSGASTNIDLRLGSKGTGAVQVRTKFALFNETRTVAGAISLTKPLTLFNSGISMAMTLANGTVNGEVKKFINIGAGTVTITPTSFGQGTSVAIVTTGTCEAIWTGTNWFLMSDDSTFLTIT